MLIPNKRFRANPNRAVYVQGIIDQELIDRLTPTILQLQNESRDPITVYIDSPGGNPAMMENLYRLLKASNQDFEQPCWIITVTMLRAASAAADLLSSGDYALAFPDSVIWFHGIRVPWDNPLTAEDSASLAQLLRGRNDRYAAELTQKAESRFMFRFATMKQEFDTVRQNSAQPLSDFDCFLTLILERVSDKAKEVVEKAKQRYHRYDALLRSALASYRTGHKTMAELEADLLKAIIDVEVTSSNDPSWSFRADGLQQLSDDFFLLLEHIENYDSPRFQENCSRWGRFLLSPTELDEINQAPENERADRIKEKVRPHLQPIWSFFVALCNVLQQGENNLTGTDALRLGLIDEIIGVKDLPYLRVMVEYEDDPEPPEETTQETTEQNEANSPSLNPPATQD